MAEFGETTVAQTTLASMFPISYQTMLRSMPPILSPKTPQPLAPVAPEKVRSLILTPFSLNYTGNLKMADLNTELLFLARAVSSATQSVPGGSGVVGGEALIIDVTFTDVTVDDVMTPLVIQGLTTKGNITFSGSSTSFGSVHVGFNSISGNLAFGPDVTVASLELYDCSITGNIVLPSGSSLTSILVYGQYPQISLLELSNTKVYPVLTSLLYLNGTDGKGPRDIPSGARGFGAYTLSGLTQAVYPLITTLALPDPWEEGVDLGIVFPNLVSLFMMGGNRISGLSVPATPSSKYSMLTIIGVNGITSINLSEKAGTLTTGIRIAGCSSLTSVVLRNDPQAVESLQEYRTLIVERCALIYLRGTRGMNRIPTTLRLGDHTSPAFPAAPRTASRLLDYILQAVPDLGPSLRSVPSDYLPNVIVSLAEIMPSLILYPVMQTVEYIFSRPAAVIASDPAGGLTTTYTQYSGGANPVVPTGGSLNNITITVSPFGLRYTLRVNSQAASISSPLLAPPANLGGNLKNVLFPSSSTGGNHRVKIIMGAAIIAGVLLVVIGVIILAVKMARSKVLLQSSLSSASGIQIRR